MVCRFDKATFSKAARLDNGMLRAPARLSRTGVFEYQQSDGSVRRELRLPEEVFAADSMASFELLPVTDDHPNENGGRVTADNVKRLSVGTVGAPIREGRFLAGTLMVADSAMVAKAEAGKQELSLGYFCDLEPAKPGAVWQDSDTGERLPYDFIQRNIRGNHVAIVDRGRAGPEVRMQLDAADAVQLGDVKKPAVKIEKKMEKTEAEILAVAALAAAKAESDKHAARADAAEAKIVELEKSLAAANDPAKLHAAVAARVALETAARVHLGPDAKLDALDSHGVKSAVVAKLSASVKLDGKSADYVDALFEHLTADAAKKNPVTEKIAAEQAAAPHVDSDNLTAEERMYRRYRGEE